KHFGSMMPASGVRRGANGGTLRTGFRSLGLGALSAAHHGYFCTAGRPGVKIRIEARMNGDQPLSTAAVECRFNSTPGSQGPEPTGMRFRGFQYLRNRTITSSEKTAETTSTRPQEVS